MTEKPDVRRISIVATSETDDQDETIIAKFIAEHRDSIARSLVSGAETHLGIVERNDGTLVASIVASGAIDHSRKQVGKVIHKERSRRGLSILQCAEFWNVEESDWRNLEAGISSFSVFLIKKTLRQLQDGIISPTEKLVLDRTDDRGREATYKALSGRIREAREAIFLTCEDVAEFYGITGPEVIDMESNLKGTRRALSDVLAALNANIIPASEPKDHQARAGFALRKMRIDAGISESQAVNEANLAAVNNENALNALEVGTTFVWRAADATEYASKLQKMRAPRGFQVLKNGAKPTTSAQIRRLGKLIKKARKARGLRRAQVREFYDGSQGLGKRPLGPEELRKIESGMSLIPPFGLERILAALESPKLIFQTLNNERIR